MAGHTGSDRLDRALELLVNDHELFRQEHKQLLTAQVLLTDRLDNWQRWAKKTDERLNALITVVDGIIRKQFRSPLGLLARGREGGSQGTP